MYAAGISYTHPLTISPLAGRHGPMQHYCWWNKYVANPIKKDGYQGPGRLAMRVLKEEILPAILLRRTKVQCADVLALPPRCAGSSSYPMGLCHGACWHRCRSALLRPSHASTSDVSTSLPAPCSGSTTHNPP